MKKTEWFDSPPAMVGVYETRGKYGDWFQFWNGSFWGYQDHSPRAAYRCRNFRSASQDHKWRGLTTKDGK